MGYELWAHNVEETGERIIVRCKAEFEDYENLIILEFCNILYKCLLYISTRHARLICDYALKWCAPQCCAFDKKV